MKMNINIKKSNKYSILEKCIIVLLSLYLFTLYLFIEGSKTYLVSKVFFAITVFFMLINIIVKLRIPHKILCPAIVSLAIFVSLCFISVIWSPLPSVSLTMSITMMQLLIMVIVFYYSLSSFGDTELFIKIIAYAGIAMSIYLINYYSIGTYINALLASGRIGDDFANVNSVGGAAAVTLISCIYMTIFYKKVIYLPLAILPGIVLLGAGSRTAIVVAVIGIFLTFIYNSQNRKWIAHISQIILLFLFIYILVTNIPNIKIFNSVYDRFNIMFQVLIGNSNGGSTYYRLEMMKIGWQIFFNNPIFGNGINATALTLKSNGVPYTYLHNNYIEILADLGIVGFVSYYYIYFYIITKLNKQKRINLSATFFLILLLSMLVLDIGGITYYMQRNYVYLVFALVIATQKFNINKYD